MQTEIGPIMGLDWLSPTPEPVEIRVPVIGDAGDIIPLAVDLTSSERRKLQIQIGKASGEVAVSFYLLGPQGTPIPFQIEDRSNNPDPSPNTTNPRQVLSEPVAQITYRKRATPKGIWFVDDVATPDNRKSLQRFADHVGVWASVKKIRLERG